jgi:hypothetical protein
LGLSFATINPVKDNLQQFQTLKTKLSAERESIQNRLNAINAVLGSMDNATAPALVAEPSSTTTSNASGYSPRKGTLPAKILKVLEKNGTAMQVKGIAAAAKRSGVLVNQACVMLLKKGNLKREGRGQYSLA